MTKCTHKNKMFPVSDNNNWVVGFLCDCGYFEVRDNLPSYDERRKSRLKYENEGRRLHDVKKN